MAWNDDSDNDKTYAMPSAASPEETKIVELAHKRYKVSETWEATARVNFDFDYKFANADTHNKYQWDADLVLSRELDQKPCLTINKTQQHNLMVINDAKQNKPGIRIRPVGDQATFEGAQIYQELVYHIEYISNAENVYDHATTFQVEAGIGYWRVCTDYISDDTFDQEIYIRKIKDPRSVYLDPDINEPDGSDARFGIVFEDMPKDLFCEKYPDFAAIASSTAIGNAALYGWLTENHVRVAEYYTKEEQKDKLVTWTNENGQVIKKVSELTQAEKAFYQELKKQKQIWEQYEFQQRKIVTDAIKWYKIAGNRIIEKGDWLGKYVPIVRLVGTETVIDGVLDRKGHTRALINAQQIYNYNTSANVEFGALQTKAPWVAPTAAIEGFEEYYKTANRVNHSYLPYNQYDEDGNKIDAPHRPLAPQASPAYVQQMEIAQNEMMMVTGQYQAQFGENENAKSGVAINARQRQGDRATYHFIDNQAIAIRFTGKIVIDLVPKIYDTKRIKKIVAQDGTKMDVTIDPKLKQATQDVTPKDPAQQQMDNGQKIKEIIFNPSFGMYDIQADVGPSFATKRMETASVLTQIAVGNKELMPLIGDILFKNLDFNGADILAERFQKMLPPQAQKDAPDPHTEQLMEQASQHIELLSKQLADATQKLADKDKELTIKAQTLDLSLKKETAVQAREDYKAETQRAKDLFNTGTDGSGVAPEFRQVVLQLVKGMMANGELNFTDNDDVTTGPEAEQEMQGMEQEAGQEEPPMEGAKKAADGMWYVQNPEGGFSRVEMQ